MNVPVSDRAMSNMGRFHYVPRYARVVAWEVRPAETPIPARYRKVETTPLSVPISKEKNDFTIAISAP